MEPIIKEREYSKLFKLGLYLKGLGAISDIVNGILFWFINKVFIITFFVDFFQKILSDDPKDYISTFLVDSVASLSVSSQYFLGAYLFIHGIIKLFLVVNLFRKKLWAYPASIIIFSLIIGFSFYELYYNYSIWLLAFTILDIIVVLLAGHEYGVLRKKNKKLMNLVKNL